jgi:hypothetical protein
MDVLSKIKKVEQMLLGKGSITSIEAIRKFHYTRLADGIFVLRNRGFEIESVWETSSAGNRYTRYVYTGKRKRATAKVVAKGDADRQNTKTPRKK